MRLKICLSLLLFGLLTGHAFVAVWGLTSGNPETEVFNRPAVTSQVPEGGVVSPGQANAVIQDVVVNDPGTDPYPTAISIITIKKVSGSTLADRFITRIRLYRENGLQDGFQPSGAEQDELLGEMLPAQFEPIWGGPGITFGLPGHVLIRVENGTEERFYVVADFAVAAPDGATLRTSFDVSADDDLVGGPTVSSGFDPALKLPLLAERGAVQFIRVASTTGLWKTDVTDDTKPVTAGPGDVVVAQEVMIEDPGTLGITDPGDTDTLVSAVIVREAPDSTLPSHLIKRLRLFRESPASPPGFQLSDELLGEVNKPNLSAGAVFSKATGRPLFIVKREIPERLYVVADLASAGVETGQILRTQLMVFARDIAGVPSSGIETPMPLVAQNAVEIEIPPPTVEITFPCGATPQGPCPRSGTGQNQLGLISRGLVQIAIKGIPGRGLSGMRIGPNSTMLFDPTVIQVRTIRAVDPYTVRFFNASLDTAPEVNAAGQIQMEIGLKQGRKPITQGVVVEIEIEKAPNATVGQTTEIRIVTLPAGIIVDGFFYQGDDGLPHGIDIDPVMISGIVQIELRKGDVDGNNKVEMEDARQTAQFILGLRSFDELQTRAADVCAPVGVVDATDVRCIAEAALGIRRLPTAIALNTNSSIAPLSSAPALSVERWAAPGAGGGEFVVQGTGIAALRVELFNLTGAPVATLESPGNRLRWDDSVALANGIYLYRVTVLGADGSSLRSAIRKIAVLR